MKSCQNFLVILATAFTILLSGCQSIDLPKGTSAGYESFRFIEPNLANDERFEVPSDIKDQLIQAAIKAEFKANGLGFDPEGANLVVGYLIIKQDNVSTMAIPTYYGIDSSKIRSLAHKKGVLKNESWDTFQVGAIVIDIFDTATNKLVYRNFAKRNIKGIADEAELESLIGSAVTETLDAFFE